MIRIGTGGLARARVLRPGLTLVAAVMLAACAGQATGSAASAADTQVQVSEQTVASDSAARTGAEQEQSSTQPAAPAIDCSNLVVTPAQTEGPYFTPSSPERTSLLEPGMAGTAITITGYVVDTNCQPVASALLDFWQANDAGQYDNAGYTLRGHQYTDENGRFQLETVVPGLYPGRTRHIHVKVQAPGGPVLTSQLYFPDEPGNGRDGIFRPETVLQNVQQADDGTMTATFTFVLDLR